MKTPLITLAWMVGWIALCLFLSGCVTTTTTAPDGSVTITKAPAPGVLPFAGAVLEAYSPRAIVVREEKSGDIMRILRGRPITRAEIAARWQPSTP